MQTTTRKIINLAGAYFVNIPIGFARYHKLRYGDKVEVVTKNDVVTIRLLKEG